MERRDKINYYLDIAEAVTGRGTCLRRNFGAVIVKNDTIISTGYVGAPRGRANCNELGATLYLVGLECSDGSYVRAAAPCSLCKHMIINAGIERVIVRDTRDSYRVFEVDEEWVARDDSVEGILGY